MLVPVSFIALAQRTIACADRARGRASLDVNMSDIGPRNEGIFSRTGSEVTTELRQVDGASHDPRTDAGLCIFKVVAPQAGCMTYAMCSVYLPC